MVGTIGRRTALLTGIGAALAAAGCTPSSGQRAVTTAELYVGLARSRAVAILDAATDRVTGRISLASLGRDGLPSQIGVGPHGGVAVLPLISSTTSVDVIEDPVPTSVTQVFRRRAVWPGHSRAARAAGGAAADPSGDAPANVQPNAGAADKLSYAKIAVGTPAAANTLDSLPDSNPARRATAQALAADARGQVYVLVGDTIGAAQPTAAIVDLASGNVTRHLTLGALGESVLALAIQPDGRRLYASLWRWDVDGGRWGAAGAGRIVAIDTASGQAVAETALPEATAATRLAIATAPAGSGAGIDPAVYAVLTIPGPAYGDLQDWTPPHRYTLLAFDGKSLDTLSLWPLADHPTALTVMPDGRRAYLLTGEPISFSQAQQLISLDLANSAVTQRWPLPGGCLSLAMGPLEKLYVADTFGDRLWRVDTRRDTLLGAIPMEGAPLALAARPA